MNKTEKFPPYLTVIFNKKKNRISSNNQVTSDSIKIGLGIPQASVLGSILFIVNYITGIIENPNWYSITTFADATNIMMKCDNLFTALIK